MWRERIAWIVALLLVAGVGFFSGQFVGVRLGEQNRAQAIQSFFTQRGGSGASGQGGQGFPSQGGAQGGQSGAGQNGQMPEQNGQTAPQQNGQSSQDQNGQTATSQGQNGQAPSGQGQNGQGGFRGSPGLMGTVSAISGNTITVTARDGSTSQIELAADGQVHKQVDGALSDIKEGDQIIATGTRDGDVFQATSIQIGTAAAGTPATP